MTVMERPAPNLLFLPYIAGFTERIERRSPPWNPSDLWLQGQDERSSNESEVAHPQTRQEGSCLQGTLWKVQSCVHRRNRKNSEKATHRTQSNSKEVQHQERHCSICLEVWTPSGVGVCQSERSCTKPHSLRECRSSSYPPEIYTEHDKPDCGLTLDSI